MRPCEVKACVYSGILYLYVITQRNSEEKSGTYSSMVYGARCMCASV
jgi:hypothetical protein